MKQRGKRLLSSLLTLVMLLGMLPGMTIEARADGNVATIGTTEYTTLQEALNAATDGQTVKLLKTVTESVTLGTMYDTTDKSVTLDLNGNSVTGSEIYAIMVLIGSLTLTDSGSGGKISNPSGGAVSVKGGATFIMKGGSLCNNKPTSSYGGAGVVNLEQRYVQGAVQSGKFQMEGGAIENNESSANTGCGVYMSPGSTFTMTGGRISNNTGNNSVGVYVAGGSTFTMTGGEISGNTAASSVQGYSPYGAGVRVQVGGNAVFGGTAKVTGNKKIVESNEIPNNVDLQGQDEETRAKIKVSTTTPFAEGASVGITLGTQDGKGVFTKDIADDTARDAAKPYFFSDDPKLSVLPTVAADNADHQLKLNVITYAKLEHLTITNTTDASRNGTSNQEDTYPWVGDVLQANVEGATSVTYQWYRVNADGTETKIDGATEQTYKATAADVDCHLKVVATQSVEGEGKTLPTPILLNAMIGPVALRPAPTPFEETHPNYPTSTNGQITKTDADAEAFANLYYSADNGATWIKVGTDGETANNLSAGTYLFQYRDSSATDGKHAESKIATVILTAQYDLIWLKISKVSPDDKKVNATVKAVTNLDEKEGNLPDDTTTLTYNWYFIDKDGTREETPVATNSATCEILESYAGGKLLAEAVWKNGDTVIKTLTTPTPIIAASPASTSTVRGSVKKPNSAEENATTSGVSGAIVELRQGNTVIATATTDGDGNYDFGETVSDGEYNIVVTTSDGKTSKTEQIKVDGHNAEKSVVLPFYDVSSLIVVQGNTPAVVVSKLDELAKTESGDISDLSTAVEVKLTVEGKEDLTEQTGLTGEQAVEQTNQIDVKNKAKDTTSTGTVVEFIDMSIIKSTTTGGKTTTEAIRYTGEDNVLRIRIPYTTTGRYQFGIYRKHDDGAGHITIDVFKNEASHSDGTFVVGEGYLDVYATKFSTYAIGYTTTEPVSHSSGGSSKPSISPANANSVKRFADPAVTGITNWLITDDHILYIRGYNEDGVSTVRPENNITRAEAAMMFYRLLKNQNVPITKTFTDVSEGQWYAQPIGVLASLGIIDGYNDGSFLPNRTINRAEFAKIATKFAIITGGKTKFSDVSESHWANSFIATAADYGWISGYEDGTYRPNDFMTRAAAAKIINYMLGRVADRDFVLANRGNLVSYTDLTNPNAWYYFEIIEASIEHDFIRENDVEKWNR